MESTKIAKASSINRTKTNGVLIRKSKNNNTGHYSTMEHRTTLRPRTLNHISATCSEDFLPVQKMQFEIRSRMN